MAELLPSAWESIAVRRRRTVAAALSVALAYAGCGSEPTTAGPSATPVEVPRPESAPTDEALLGARVRVTAELVQLLDVRRAERLP